MNQHQQPNESSVIRPATDSVSDITQPKRDQEVQRQSEEKYRILFEKINAGFSLNQAVRDQTGKMIDYRLIELNPAFEKLTGLNAKEAVGKTILEIIPNLDPWWIDTYRYVVDAQQTIRAEKFLPEVDRWYDLTAFYYKEDQFAAYYDDITERKRAQETVRQNEERQAFLLQLSDTLRPLSDPLAIQAAAADLLGTRLGVNHAHYGEVRGEYIYIAHSYSQGLPPMTGKFHADSFGKRLMDGYRSATVQVCFDTAADPLFNAEERQVLQGANIGAYIAAPLVKAGEWVATLAVQNTEPRGWTPTEVGLVQYVAERTWAAVERARAEEALRASDKRFRLAIEATELGTWEWNLETNEVYWNERHFWLFGMEPQPNPIGPDAFMNHVHPADRERVSTLLQRAIDERSVYDTEFCAVLEDGSQRWMSGYGRIVEEIDGKPLRMSGVMFDITQQKKAAEALYQSEARQRAILQSAKDYAIFTTDLERRITSWSRGAQAVFGFTEEQILHQSADLLFTPEDRQQGAPKIEAQRAASQGEAENERWHCRQDGSRFYGSGVVTPLRDEAGAIVGILKVVRNLTVQKQAEQALNEADQRKDEFLAMLAHELRNPMSTIRSGLQILTLTGGKDQTSSDTIALMNRQTDHLVRLVDDLLDVSRISQGKIELKRERLELGSLVKAVLDAIRPQFETAHKILHVSPFPSALFTQGDPTRLTQVVTNLLTNGLRYTGSQGQVWVSLSQQNGEALLRITDNGIGLSGNQLTNIFELFVQADNSLARSRGGLGVGLTLAKRLVDLHGGQVVASSPGLGQGSTFTVGLPLVEAPTSEPAAEGTVAELSIAQRVLVIDDNADAALTLSMLLKLKGCEVHSRLSGQEGIQAAESLRPAVILCDIGMPDMDGYETARLIRQQPWGASMALIALTGYGQDEDKQRALEAGFDEHLLKPVDFEALLALLKKVLPTG